MKASHWPLTALNTFVSLLQLFLPLLLVRIFDAESVGSYKIFFLYTGLIPMVSLGVGLLHGIPFWTGIAEKRKELLQQVWSLLILHSLLIVGCGLLFSGKISSLLRATDQEALLLIISGAVYLPVAFYEESWVALGKVWRTAIFRVSAEALRTAFILFIAWEYRQIYLVILAHTGIAILKFLVASYLSRDYIAFKISFSGNIRLILSYAVPVSCAGLLSTIADYSDQLLMSSFLTRAEFAAFALGCLLVPPLFALEQSVNQVLMPRLSLDLAAKDSKSGMLHYQEAIEELSRFMIPSFVGLLIFAEPIVKILFTDKFIAAADILRIYAFSYLLMIIPYDGGPKASGNGRWPFLVYCVKAVISVGLVWILAKKFGPQGAVAGVILSGLFLRSAGLFFNVKFLGWPLKQFLPLLYLIKLSALSAGLGAASYLCRRFFVSDIVWFIVCGLAFSTVYARVALWPVFKRRFRAHNLAKAEQTKSNSI